MKKIIKTINIITIVVTLYVAIIAAIFVVPRIFGIMPYIVQSGSMEPEIPTGSVAFINQKDRNPDIGEIITYRVGEPASIGTGTGSFVKAERGTLVTHRLIDITPDGDYITKGDANDVADMVPIYPSQIVGTYKMNIPKMGGILAKIGKKTLTAILIGIFILNIVSTLLGWAWGIDKDDEKKEKAEEDAKEASEEDADKEKEENTDPANADPASEQKTEDNGNAIAAKPAEEANTEQTSEETEISEPQSNEETHDIPTKKDQN